MGVDVNPTGIKAAMSLRGLLAEEFRLPLVPVTPEAKEQIRKQMEIQGLLDRTAVKR
jgi:dihydrodipicolinate synthase/N-acetylneuraminate lyase